MKTEIAIQIIIEQPLPGVVYALQSGSGKTFENLQGQLGKENDLLFSGIIGVKAADQNGELPDFNGALVQGPKFSRFLYIGIGTYAGQPGSVWARRLKIPLAGITWDMISQMSNIHKRVLTTSVPGIGKDGGPNCATVKPFGGWTLITKA